MREFNLLAGYPEAKKPRVVSSDIRTIKSRIIASYRDREFYDGDRSNGYGGFRYDGRWVHIAKRIVQEYGLSEQSSVLQIGCDKGFLLHDILQCYPKMKVRGAEISDYAIEQAMESVKSFILKSHFVDLSFKTGEFDFVIAMGVVYSLNLTDAIRCLKEIQRVGKGKSFITLASYESEEDKQLFEWWTLLGTTLLRRDEWVEVLRHVGYTGDYKFVSARSLSLVEQKDAVVS
jgi:hypothetical protein